MIENLEVKLILLNHNPIDPYLIIEGLDWKEGWAYDSKKMQVIYYNGDYGDERPEGLKKVIAMPEQIGYVYTGSRMVKNSDGIPIDYHRHFEEVTPKFLLKINRNGGRCFIEREGCTDCKFNNGFFNSPDCCHEYKLKYIDNKVIIHERLHSTL